MTDILARNKPGISSFSLLRLSRCAVCNSMHDGVEGSFMMPNHVFFTMTAFTIIFERSNLFIELNIIYTLRHCK